MDVCAPSGACHEESRAHPGRQRKRAGSVHERDIHLASLHPLEKLDDLQRWRTTERRGNSHWRRFELNRGCVMPYADNGFHPRGMPCREHLFRASCLVSSSSPLPSSAPSSRAPPPSHFRRPQAPPPHAPRHHCVKHTRPTIKQSTSHTRPAIFAPKYRPAACDHITLWQGPPRALDTKQKTNISSPQYLPAMPCPISYSYQVVRVLRHGASAPWPTPPLTSSRAVCWRARRTPPPRRPWTPPPASSRSHQSSLRMPPRARAECHPRRAALAGGPVPGRVLVWEVGAPLLSCPTLPRDSLGAFFGSSHRGSCR